MTPAEVLARNRRLMRELLARPEPEPEPQRRRRVLLLVAMVAPVVAAFAVAVAVSPRTVANVAVAAGIGAGVLALLLPCALVVRRRADRALTAAAAPACAALGAAARAVPVRYGLNTAARDATTGPAAWDGGPQRPGAVAVTADALLLRGADGAALDVPLTALLGAVDQPGTWPVQGCVDLHLHAGEAIQLRTPHRRRLVAALRAAGVRVPR